MRGHDEQTAHMFSYLSPDSACRPTIRAAPFGR